jgi:antitoxin (DNA-binding transcriptional repressor) of toxin-antitoxin stability system
MKKVKIADLKNHLSRHLLYVRDGGQLLVCDREVPVAYVVPFAGLAGRRSGGNDEAGYWTSDRLARLERQGTVVRGDAPERDWVGQLRPAALPKGTPSAVETLLKERRESTR